MKSIIKGLEGDAIRDGGAIIFTNNAKYKKRQIQKSRMREQKKQDLELKCLRGEVAELKELVKEMAEAVSTKNKKKRITK